MPGSDSRKINSGIVLPHEGGGKTVGYQSRTWTKDDDFDELEEQLTPEQVTNLKLPDPVTGVPPLEGNWKGRHPGRAPMRGSLAHRQAVNSGGDPTAPVKVAVRAEEVHADFSHLSARELTDLCEKHGCEVEGQKTKAKMADALVAKGVKPPKG